MREDELIRMKFAAILLTAVTLAAWGMWRLVTVE